MNDAEAMADSRSEKLSTFVSWVQAHIQGDEKGEAHIFLDHLFQAFGHPGSLEVGDHEFRIRKAGEDGGGTSLADFVWKPVVLIEMKKRGENLAKHYRQAFDYWTGLVPGRPKPPFKNHCSAVTREATDCHAQRLTTRWDPASVDGAAAA